MNFSDIESHLGVTLKRIDKDKAKDLYEIKNFKISELPLKSLRLQEEDKDAQNGLAYKMEY